MRTTVIALILSLCMATCNAQAPEQIPEKKNEEHASEQPKVSWSVKKKLDENGNIIQYDSTYSWSYTNLDGDSVTVNADSVLRSFNLFFDQNYSSMWNQFKSPWNNLTPGADFFRDDYYWNLWQHDFFNMEDMMRQIDSMRNSFFQYHYPGLIDMHKKENKEQGKKI